MILSNRLSAIAQMVPKSKKIADIGTDHGYIPLFLIQNNIADYAIAADISRDSLKKAENLMRQYHMESRMETRLGSGLSVLLPGEVETIIIAGMGGLLISEILEDGALVARSAKTIILQPMTSVSELRQWLDNNGYSIVDEELILEGRRYYEIIVAEPNWDQNVSYSITDPIYYEISHKLIDKGHPLLEGYVLDKIRKLENALEHTRKSDSPASISRREELAAIIQRFKEVYQWEIKSGI